MDLPNVPGVKGATIQLANGHYFDYTRPGDSLIDIESIAHALSNLCRFTGHCRAFYSVAQHCVLMSQIVPAIDQLYALLHEASEPVVADLNKPLKMLLREYDAIEGEAQRAILAQFGLDPDMRPASIKPADWTLLATEQRDLMPTRRAVRWGALGFAVEWEHLPLHEWSFTAGVTPLADSIEPWTPEVAKAAFLERFRILVAGALPNRSQSSAQFDRPPRFDFSKVSLQVAGALSGISEYA